MTEVFCHSILQLTVKKSKALCNLVMALASQVFANSVTELSLSACFHYQYSSICDSINALFEKKDFDDEETAQKERLELEKKFIY